MRGPASSPLEGLEAPVHGNLLGPTVRRDLADLNRQYLELSLAPELQADPRFAWSDPVRRSLLATDEATRGRMAECPFALFHLLLPAERECAAGSGRVEDGQRPAAGAVVSGRCTSFLHLALFLAWRLADAAPLATRLALGLSPASELRLNETSAWQLVQLAASPQLIRPRWPAHPQFWATLAVAAQRDSAAALQRAHCVGICLSGAERNLRAGTRAAAGPRSASRP